MPFNHILHIITGDNWRLLETGGVTPTDSVVTAVTTGQILNFDNLFSAVWLLTTFIFRALITDRIVFYALLSSTVHRWLRAHLYRRMCSNSTPSLVYRVNMQIHSHSC